MEVGECSVRIKTKRKVAPRGCQFLKDVFTFYIKFLISRVIITCVLETMSVASQALSHCRYSVPFTGAVIEAESP